MPIIRASRDEDVPAITAIYRHHVLHGTGTFEIDPPTEADMLARVLDPKPASRLACQIRIDASLDGLIVHLPKRQRVP